MIQIFSLRFASDTILPVTGGPEGTTDYLKTEPQNAGAGLAGVHALRAEGVLDRSHQVPLDRVLWDLISRCRLWPC